MSFKPVTYLTIRNYEVEWVYVSANNKSVKRVIKIKKGLHLSYASQLTAALELLMNVDGENGIGESELRVVDHTTIFWTKKGNRQPLKKKWKYQNNGQRLSRASNAKSGAIAIPRGPNLG
jgi:hypothetical protein